MANSPSHKWENGVLVERALDIHEPAEKEEVEPKATRPYKVPVPTKMVAAAENKAVKKASKK